MKLGFAAVGLGILLTTQSALAQEPAPAAPAEPPAEAPRAPSGPLAKPDPEGPQVHHTAWPYLLAGTGLALVITGIVLEVSSVHQNDQADSADQTLAQLQDGDPRKPSVQADRDDHHDSASTDRTAAIIFATAGSLTLAGSVILWFVEAGQPAPSGGTSAGLKTHFVPTFGPGHAGAAFTGTF